jgi:Ca2+-binding RTX toxin-like protein
VRQLNNVFQFASGRVVEARNAQHEAHMATFVFTVAEFNAYPTKPFAPEDDVTIADVGQAIDGLTPADLAAFAAARVDVIDATNDSMYLSTSQLEALGSVRLTAGDLVVLADTGAELAAGSLAQISSLAARNVDAIDVTDNVALFSLAQLNALPVPLSPGDVVFMTDSGAALSNLAPSDITGLSAKGVVGFNATDNVFNVSVSQYLSFGAFQLAPEDVFKVNGTNASETINGRSSNDHIKGFGGNDGLNGGDGNDWLYGGAGKDVMVGGGGADGFVFDTKLNKKTNYDTVRDFNVRDDSVYLDNAIFKKLGKGSEANPGKLKKAFFQVGTKADDRDDYLIYNKKTGVLYYDADGSGSAKQVEIAKLSKNLKLTEKDFFII